MTDSQSVAVIGLGYVGLTLAIAMAQRGINVVGVERRPAVVELIRNGTPHFSEEGLEDALRDALAKDRFRVSTTLADFPPASTYVITVGTPLSDDGQPRLDMVENATREVIDHMEDGALIVLRSTVKIGTTRDVVGRTIADAGRSALLAMCPERTLEGDALREITSLPQIVGGIDAESADRAAGLFGALTHSIVRVSSPETAEMIKLIDNTFRDVRFAFANEVARACDAIGINANEVISFGKLGYPRTNVALPGLVGGPCLEKDPHILRHSLAEHGLELEITRAARKVNERQPAETVAQAIAMIRDRGVTARLNVAVAGMAFKGLPETDDLRGSMAIPLIRALQATGAVDQITAFDHVVPIAAMEELGLDIRPVATLAEAVDGAHILFIANNHPDFRKSAFDGLVTRMSPEGFVYDYWNHFGHESSSTLRNRYMTVGNIRARSI